MGTLEVVQQVLSPVWAIALLAFGLLNAVVARRGNCSREAETGSRLARYLSAVRGLGILTFVTLAIDFTGQHIGLNSLLASADVATLLFWTLLTTIGCIVVSIGFLIIRRMLRNPLPRSVVTMMPKTRRELTGGLLLSLFAGFTEEYLFRGFCLLVILSVSGSTIVSFVLVAIFFGIGHGYQDKIGVVRATIAGAVLAIPVLEIGFLLPSIIAHAGIDMLSFSIGYTSVLQKWGLLQAPADPAT